MCGLVYNATVGCVCSIHVIVEEKIVLTAGRDGGLENMEVLGMVKLKIADDKYTRVRINVINNDTKGIQIQVTAVFTGCNCLSHCVQRLES